MPPRRKLVPPSAKASRPLAASHLDAFLQYVRSECHLAENTVAAYRRDLGRFKKWLGARSVAALTIRDLSDYAAWLHGEKLAPASIARHIVSLRMFFRYLQV